MNDFDVYNNEHVQNLGKTLEELRKQFDMVRNQFKEAALGSPESKKLEEKLNRLNLAIKKVKSLFDDCVVFLKSLR